MIIDLGLFNLDIDSGQFLLFLKIGGSLLLFIFLIAVFLIFFWWIWLPSRRKKWVATVEYVLLAVDVPKEDEQSPKAVEHIFSTLAGMLTGPNKYEKYWIGKYQLSLSLELVSREGYIQYLVYTPVVYRDLVEAAFYAQYPDAEISIVDDYTKDAPSKFPNENYDLWGTDFILKEPSAYPIRTYPEFEHSLSQELKDPVATLLEEMSRLGKGEYIWLQWVITPTRDDWKKESEKVVKKIIGEKGDTPKDFAYYLIQPFVSFMKWLGDILVIQAENTASTAPVVRSEPNKILYLTAGQKDVLQGVEQKMKKTGFLVKGRMIYYAKREIFQKSRGVSSIIGAINQFNTLNMNSFIKDKRSVTSADYLRVEKRMAKKQNRIIKAYRKRIGDKSFGSPPFILNIEELATLYHFPNFNVKAPLIKTTVSRRGQAPVTLPTAHDSQFEEIVKIEGEEKSKEMSSARSEDASSDGDNVKIIAEDKVISAKDDIIKSMSTVTEDEDKVTTKSVRQKSDPVVVVVDENEQKADTSGNPPTNLPV